MSFNEINLDEFELNPFTNLRDKWFLLTVGDEKSFNTMTCSWGMIGHIWFKNVFNTVVRPQRYTYEFINKYDNFTITFLPDEYKKVLSFCGTKSGRDFDKVKETGLTPVFLEEGVTFEEAERVIVCKKLYCQAMDEKSFVDKEVMEKAYKDRDFHYSYVGEILKILENK